MEKHSHVFEAICHYENMYDGFIDWRAATSGIRALLLDIRQP
jgi:hypothetical protein